MRTWPLKFRELEEDQILFADDAGGFFLADNDFLDRLAREKLVPADKEFLIKNGHGFERENDLQHVSYLWRWTARQARQDTLSYIILVPTLRCNLACSYCQVSRAPETAKNFDWTEDTLGQVLAFLDGIGTDRVKVEFQGGEPLLRTDILQRVRDFCRERFVSSEFVVCTNLQNLGSKQIAFLEDDDTYISTSLDGPLAIHDRHRTQDRKLANEFFANLEFAVRRFGPSRISALPTIDIDAPPDLNELIDTYAAFGMRSIYLRPVNYQGFARTRHPGAGDFDKWAALYDNFIDLLVDRNFESDTIFEEYYFSHCLRRVLRPGHDSHVDLRNPGFFAADYIVVDFDGRLYPTDEARMLTRIGQIDLSVGSVADGFDRTKIDQLNASAFNNCDPECIHCPYQPFCGSDPIDDISRYGRVDLPRGETWFCKRQRSVFDRIMKLIYSKDERDRFSLCHWAGVPDWPDNLATRYHDPAAL